MQEKFLLIMKHAKQGVAQPEFAKDQCALIVEVLLTMQAPMVSVSEALRTDEEAAP